MYCRQVKICRLFRTFHMQMKLNDNKKVHLLNNPKRYDFAWYKCIEFKSVFSINSIAETTSEIPTFKGSASNSG